MATLANNNLNEDENGAPQGPISLSQGAGGATGGSASGSAGGSSAAPGISASGGSSSQNLSNPQKGGTSSGRFVNIQNYLNANKGYNEQGGGLAGQITNDISKQAQGVQDKFSQDKQNFQQQAEAGRNQYNEGLVNQAVQDPNAFVGNQQNMQNWQKMQSGQYAGPQQFQGGQQYQQQAQDIGNLANMAQSESGRSQVLKQLYGTPGYASGQRSLDNLLLQSNNDQLQQLQSLKPAAENLQSGVESGSNEANALAQQYSQEAAATKAKLNEQIGGAKSGFETGLNNDYSNFLKGQNDIFSGLQNKLATGQALSPEEAITQLGLGSGDTNRQLYGTKASDYLHQNANPTLASYADANQYAKYNALSQLAGQDPTLLNQADAAQAGTGRNAPAFNFDKNAFLGELSAREGNFNTARNTQNPIQATMLLNSPTASISQLEDVVKQYQGQNFDPANPWAKGVPAQLAQYQALIDSFNKQWGTGQTLGGQRAISGNMTGGVGGGQIT